MVRYRKGNAIMLGIQMALIAVGTAMIVFGMINSKQVVSVAQLARFVMFLSFVSMIIYAVRGYRAKVEYYLGAIYAFSGSLLFTVLNVKSGVDAAVNALAFGLVLVYAQKLGSKRQALGIMTAVCAILLVSTVYRVSGFIAAGTLSLPKFCNNFGQPVLAGTLEVMYLTDSYRKKYSTEEREKEK